MIYTELNASDMHSMLKTCGRNNFSMATLEAYEQFIEEIDANDEFDPVGFDCEYIEFDLSDQDDVNCFLSDYAYMLTDDEKLELDEAEKIEEVKKILQEKTFVLLDDGDLFTISYNF